MLSLGKQQLNGEAYGPNNSCGVDDWFRSVYLGMRFGWRGIARPILSN